MSYERFTIEELQRLALTGDSAAMLELGRRCMGEDIKFNDPDDKEIIDDLEGQVNGLENELAEAEQSLEEAKNRIKELEAELKEKST